MAAILAVPNDPRCKSGHLLFKLEEIMKKEELKPGDEIPKFCPNCKKETKCKYNGVQEHFITNKPWRKLFTCKECKFTFGEGV